MDDGAGLDFGAALSRQLRAKSVGGRRRHLAGRRVLAIAMETLKILLMSMVILGMSEALLADAPQALTLDSYVKRAVDQGIQAKLNDYALQTAGYTRQIAFRQTDSPTLTLNHTNTRGKMWSMDFLHFRIISRQA